MINKMPNSIPRCEKLGKNSNWYAHCYITNDGSSTQFNSYWFLSNKHLPVTVYALNGKALMAMESFDEKSLFVSAAGNIDISHTEVAITLFNQE